MSTNIGEKLYEQKMDDKNYKEFFNEVRIFDSVIIIKGEYEGRIGRVIDMEDSKFEGFYVEFDNIMDDGTKLEVFPRQYLKKTHEMSHLYKINL